MLWRRLYAAVERQKLTGEREARLLATVQNAPHWRSKHPVKWQELLGKHTGGKVDAEAFHRRDAESYDRRVSDMLGRSKEKSLRYASSLRGRERRLFREAIERRLPDATGETHQRLAAMREAIPQDEKVSA